MCTQVISVASRTINVSTEAYSRLSSLKKDGESFTDVINRLTGKYRILDLVGMWDDETGEQIQKHVDELRESFDVSLDERYQRMVE